MLRAVIADHNAIARVLLQTILDNGDHNVISESRVKSAKLSRLAFLAPQLNFYRNNGESDIALSNLTALRNSLPKALIIAVPSAFTAQRIKHAIKGGAGGFVVKPFNEATYRPCPFAHQSSNWQDRKRLK